MRPTSSQVFERRWFARRRCLDVGCNEGLLTLALATRFSPRSMLGVDIDSGLVGKACRCALGAAGVGRACGVDAWGLMRRQAGGQGPHVRVLLCAPGELACVLGDNHILA